MTSKKIIRVAVERNHALDVNGMGAIPVNTVLEDDIHSANAAYISVMEYEGYSSEEVDDSLDLIQSEINKARKLLLDPSPRLLLKIDLCKNFIYLHNKKNI